jgi:hypothetical protein
MLQEKSAVSEANEHVATVAMVPPGDVSAVLAGAAERGVEQLLTYAREEAEGVAREVIAAANGAAADTLAAAERDAEQLRSVARREAEDIVSAARAQISRERALAEGRAAERVDAAEHEALAIRRIAWQLARADIDQRIAAELASDATPTAGPAGPAASGSTDIARTLSALQCLLDARSGGS